MATTKALLRIEQGFLFERDLLPALPPWAYHGQRSFSCQKLFLSFLPILANKLTTQDFTDGGLGKLITKLNMGRYFEGR